MPSLTSAIESSPKWKIEAASTADAPARTPSTMCCTVPAPPDAMTGTSTAAVTLRTSSTSNPRFEPSKSIDVSRISPAPSSAARVAHATTSTPVGLRPPCV